MIEFVLSVMPILSMLIFLLVIKMSAKNASLLSLLITAVIFAVTAKPTMKGFLITLEKGVGMAIFVVFIMWGAMLLYNLVNEVNGFDVINRNLSQVFDDRFALFLMISWIFASFLQGIAGYGIPVVIATSILMSAGYDPIKSAAASLVGHSWAISFGSMGSSIYAIDLVTDTPIRGILIGMSQYGSVTMLCCALGVCFIYGGFSYVKKGLKYVLPTWILMSISLYLLAVFELISVIGFVSGLVGILSIIAVYKCNSSKKEKKPLYREKINLLKACFHIV